MKMGMEGLAFYKRHLMQMMEENMPDIVDIILRGTILFKDRIEFNIAEKKIKKVFIKSKEDKDWKWRRFKAIVIESGLSRYKTEFVLNNSKLFRQSYNEGQDDLWTLREFHSVN